MYPILLLMLLHVIANKKQCIKSLQKQYKLPKKKQNKSKKTKQKTKSIHSSAKRSAFNVNKKSTQIQFPIHQITHNFVAFLLHTKKPHNDFKRNQLFSIVRFFLTFCVSVAQFCTQFVRVHINKEIIK